MIGKGILECEENGKGGWGGLIARLKGLKTMGSHAHTFIPLSICFCERPSWICNKRSKKIIMPGHWFC